MKNFKILFVILSALFVEILNANCSAKIEKQSQSCSPVDETNGDECINRYYYGDLCNDNVAGDCINGTFITNDAEECKYTELSETKFCIIGQYFKTTCYTKCNGLNKFKFATNCYDYSASGAMIFFECEMDDTYVTGENKCLKLTVKTTNGVVGENEFLLQKPSETVCNKDDLFIYNSGTPYCIPKCSASVTTPSALTSKCYISYTDDSNVKYCDKGELWDGTDCVTTECETAGKVTSKCVYTDGTTKKLCKVNNYWHATDKCLEACANGYNEKCYDTTTGTTATGVYIKDGNKLPLCKSEGDAVDAECYFSTGNGYTTCAKDTTTNNKFKASECLPTCVTNKTVEKNCFYGDTYTKCESGSYFNGTKCTKQCVMASFNFKENKTTEDCYILNETVPVFLSKDEGCYDALGIKINELSSDFTKISFLSIILMILLLV